MARSNANSASNYLSRSTSLISNSADPRPLSIAIWFKANTNGVTHALFTNNASNNPGLYVSVRTGDKLSLYSNGSYADSSTFTLSTTAWTHLGWSWDASGNVAYYVNGVANGTTAGKAFGSPSPTTGANIQAANAAAAGSNGASAEFGFWNVILNANEFAALAKGVLPSQVRPLSLVSYVPIWATHSPEIDLVSASTWTVNGTLSAANHAPVLPFSKSLWTPTLVDVSSAFQAAWARGANRLISGGVWGG